MVLGLRNDSATWLMKFHFKGSVMERWHLVSLVTHLIWPWFLKKFSVLSNLQQSQRLPKTLKENIVCSSQVSIDLTKDQNLINEVEENLYWTSVSDDMDIESINFLRSSQIELTDQKICLFGSAEELIKLWH